MAFFFSLLYILSAYLAPETLWGDLALLHIEILIVAIAFVLAFLTGRPGQLGSMIQTWALIGLSAAVAISIVLTGWLGGGVLNLLIFIPNAASFFLVYLTCRKKIHLQILVGMLFAIAVFVIANSQLAFYLHQWQSPYLLYYSADSGFEVVRIHGLSFLGDPNDFSQFLVALIPAMFLLGGKGKGFRNVVMVYLPVVFLIYGIYLTHSRGGMVSLMVVAMVAGRKKIGLVPSVITAITAFALMTVAGFSGGRDVTAGEDRVGAWSMGLQLIKTHPLFGVGFQRFAEFYEITAHNTIVVCAAELGLVGFFCWVLFTLVTVRNVYAVSVTQGAAAAEEELPPWKRGPLNATSSKLAAPKLAPQPLHLSAAGIPSGGPIAGPHSDAMLRNLPMGRAALTNPTMPTYGQVLEQEEEQDKEAGDADVRRMCNLMVISFAGFLTAGWFLSRAYTMVLYVNAGMAAAVYQLAINRGIAPPPLGLARAARLSLTFCVVALIAVYLIIRVDHFLPK